MKQERSEMLGTMRMSRLVPTISIPVMISMLVQALYNVVDSIFVARYDPNGLTAVSLAYPIQMLMVALSVGMGIGISSLISRKLGERAASQARTAAWNGLFVLIAGFGLFACIGLFLAPTLMRMTVSESLADADQILQMGTTYLHIVTTYSLGMFMAIFFERLLQATGNTVLSMITQLSGAITNMILDPIMIFGLLGCPAMGVSGAAIATVIGQFVSFLVGFLFNQFKNRELALSFRDCRIDRSLLTNIFSVGLPSTIMQAIASVMNISMNGLLATFAEGNAAVNVLNVYFKLQSFVFMPVFGLGTGVIAIVGYNFGARNRERIHSAIRVCLLWALSIMVIGTVIFMLFPTQLMSLFESADTSEVTLAMTRLGVVALRVISISFFMAAIGIILSNVYQAVGKGMYSLIMSLCRQLLVLIPAAWIIAKVTGDVNAVWWAFPVSEAISCVICLFLYRHLNKTLLSQLK